MTFISLLENCLLLVSIHISVSFSITHNSLSLSLYSRSLSLFLCTHTHVDAVLTCKTYVRDGWGRQIAQDRGKPSLSCSQPFPMSALES